MLSTKNSCSNRIPLIPKSSSYGASISLGSAGLLFAQQEFSVDLINAKGHELPFMTDVDAADEPAADETAETAIDRQEA